MAGGNADPDDHLLPGLVLHLLYGAVAGGVLVAALLTVGALGDLLAFTTVVGGLLWGIAWRLVLFVGAAVFRMNVVLALDPDPKQVGGFLLFHLVYGVVLGA